jgi:signal transduction histidine kinase
VVSVTAGVRSLKSTLRRLEAAAVERQAACAYCRYMREAWPLPKGRRLEPDETVTKRCEFCRAKLTIRLPANLPLHSFIMRESFSHNFELAYTNRAVYAFSIWSSNMTVIADIELAKGGGNKPPKPRRNHALERLKEEFDRLVMRMHKRLRAKHSAPFPEQVEIVNSIVSREREPASRYLAVEGVRDLYRRETHFLICAEMEKIIWGEVRPENEKALSEVRQEMENLIAVEEERLRAEREAEERRLEEEAERLRRQEEQKRPLLKPEPSDTQGMVLIDWSALR